MLHKPGPANCPWQAAGRLPRGRCTARVLVETNQRMLATANPLVDLNRTPVDNVQKKSSDNGIWTEHHWILVL